MKDVELEKWRVAFRDSPNDPDLDQSDEDALIEILSADSPDDAQRELLERYLDNPRALQVMKTALALRQEIRPTGQHRLFAWMALAASLMIVCTGIWLFMANGKVTSPTMDAFDQTGQLRDVQDDWSTMPHQAAILAQPPQELHVSMEVESNAAYRFFILSEQGSVIWQSPQVGNPRYKLPQDVQEDLIEGSYLWYVEIIRVEGRQEIGPFNFSVQ